MGCAQARTTGKRRALTRAPVNGRAVSPFDEEDAKTAGELRLPCRRRARSSGAVNLMIAAQAHGSAPFVTAPMSGSPLGYQASSGRMDGKSVRRLAGVRPLIMIRLCPWGSAGAMCTI